MTADTVVYKKSHNTNEPTNTRNTKIDKMAHSFNTTPNKNGQVDIFFIYMYVYDDEQFG